MENYFGEIFLTRLFLQKGMAFIYFVAFVAAFNQFPALLGKHGLLPVPHYLTRVRFIEMPSIFHWYYSDYFFKAISIIGFSLSIMIFIGLVDICPLWVSIISWLLLWFFYLSIVNVGQTFYSFGWESMLLEAGFFTAFLGNASAEPSYIPIIILRFMLFRTELGAGLIKLRHDSCWRDLTCLYYHYETQPLPNPLSFFFHRLPKWIQRLSVLFSHFVQVICPFFLFAPQPFSSIASCFIILHQLLLIVSGNFSWLNWLTIVLGFSALSDQVLQYLLPYSPKALISTPIFYDILLWLLAILTIVLSYKPIMNLFMKSQVMNFSYNPFHLINTYGAFGSITKKRYEIIIEGSIDQIISKDSPWLEYEFKGKPGSITRCPPFVAPYHLRLDWLMWFLPFGVRVKSSGIEHSGYDLWFLRLIEKLLENDQQIISLLKNNPFKESPPCFIRARFFLYEYESLPRLFAKKTWWKRTYIDDYLLPLSLPQIKQLNL